MPTGRTAHLRARTLQTVSLLPGRQADRLPGRQTDLAAVGVGPGVGHGQRAGRVQDGEIFVSAAWEGKHAGKHEGGLGGRRQRASQPARSKQQLLHQSVETASLLPPPPASSPPPFFPPSPRT